MKKETGVLLAGAAGFFVALGLLGLREVYKRREMGKKKRSWQKKLHRDYKIRYENEDQHGVEFLTTL